MFIRKYWRVAGTNPPAGCLVWLIQPSATLHQFRNCQYLFVCCYKHIRVYRFCNQSFLLGFIKQQFKRKCTWLLCLFTEFNWVVSHVISTMYFIYTHRCIQQVILICLLCVFLQKLGKKQINGLASTKTTGEIKHRITEAKVYTNVNIFGHMLMRKDWSYVWFSYWVLAFTVVLTSVSGNPGLFLSSSCQETKKNEGYIVLLVTSIIGVLVLWSIIDILTKKNTERAIIWKNNSKD